MAALSTREEENRITLYKSVDVRLGNLMGGVFVLSLLLIPFLPPTISSQDKIILKNIQPGQIILLVVFALLFTNVLFATTIVVDGDQKKLFRIKQFLHLAYFETEISFTSLAKIQIIQIPTFGRNEEYAWGYAAITRHGKRIMLNHSGYASQIIFWVKQVAEIMDVPVEQIQTRSTFDQLRRRLAL